MVRGGFVDQYGNRSNTPVTPTVPVKATFYKSAKKRSAGEAVQDSAAVKKLPGPVVVVDNPNTDKPNLPKRAKVLQQSTLLGAKAACESDPTFTRTGSTCKRGKGDPLDCYDPMFLGNDYKNMHYPYGQCVKNKRKWVSPTRSSEWFTVIVNQDFRYPNDAHGGFNDNCFPCRKCNGATSGHRKCASNDCLTNKHDMFVQAASGYFGSTHTFPDTERNCGSTHHCTPIDPCIIQKKLADINANILGFITDDHEELYGKIPTMSDWMQVAIRVIGPIETIDQARALVENVRFLQGDQESRRKRDDLVAKAAFSFTSKGAMCRKPADPETGRVECPFFISTDSFALTLREIHAGHKSARRRYDPDGSLAVRLQTEAVKYCQRNPGTHECACVARSMVGSLGNKLYTSLQIGKDGADGPGSGCWFLPCRGTDAISSGYMVESNMYDNQTCPAPQCESVMFVGDGKVITAEQINQVVNCSTDIKNIVNYPDGGDDSETESNTGGDGGGGGDDDTGKPGGGDDDTGKPGGGDDDTGKPGGGDDDTGKPGGGDDDTGKPGGGDDDTGKPGGGDDNTNKPGTSGSPGSSSGSPGSSSGSPGFDSNPGSNGNDGGGDDDGDKKKGMTNGQIAGLVAAGIGGIVLIGGMIYLFNSSNSAPRRRRRDW
jgi:hypothetical protein